MRKLFGVLLVSMLLGGIAMAKEHRFELGEVKIWYPETWSVDESSEGTVVFTCPEESASVLILAIEPEDDSTLEEDLTDLMKEFLKNLKPNEPWLERQVNGIRTVESGGEAIMEGLPVQYKVGYFEVSDEGALFFLSAVEKGSSKKYLDTMAKITNSIKRL